MNIRDAGNDFPTNAACFQTAADDLRTKLHQATLTLKQAGFGNSKKIGGYLFSTMILRAFAVIAQKRTTAEVAKGNHRCVLASL